MGPPFDLQQLFSIPDAVSQAELLKCNSCPLPSEERFRRGSSQEGADEGVAVRVGRPCGRGAERVACGPQFCLRPGLPLAVALCGRLPPSPFGRELLETAVIGKPEENSLASRRGQDGRG